jgi:hypothetical protein
MPRRFDWIVFFSSGTYRIPAEGLVERDGLRGEEVGPLPLEDLVGLFLDDEVHVAGLHPGHLVGVVPEHDPLPVAHPLFDVDLQHLALGLGLGDLALPLAPVAVALHLGDHSRGDLPDLEPDALALAGVALLDVAHDDLAVDRELDGLAVVQVLEAHLDGVVDRGTLAGTRRPAPASASSAAKEHAEQVLAAGGGAGLVVHPLEAVLVVLGPLLGVAQYLVRGVNFLELVLVPACEFQ